MNEKERRAGICMWGLGFATALVVDAVLFDGYSWLGWPMIVILLAMAVHSLRRDERAKSTTEGTRRA